jgi:hypothetical protein
MTDAHTDRDDDSATDSIQKHERLDAETVVDDVAELFRPDNTQIPPPNPDSPPPDDGSTRRRSND